MTPEEKDAVADLITQTLLKRLGDRVDVVFRYGSTVKGATHRYSDVDFSWVPSDPSLWDSITVMVGDILFDLYPLHWSTLERMAERDDWRATILEHHRVTYERTSEVGDRFRALVRRHAAFGEPAMRPAMVAKAWNAFGRAGYEYYQLCRTKRSGDRLSALVAANRIIGTTFHALVLANQASADTRRLAEMLTLKDRPADLEELVAAVTTASTPQELLPAIDALLEAVRTALIAVQRTHLKNDAGYQVVLHGAYPELTADLHGVVVACERGDRLAAQTKLASYLHELTVHLSIAGRGVAYSELNSPDEYRAVIPGIDVDELVTLATSGSLEALSRASRDVDSAVRRRFRELGVDLSAYSSADDLASALEMRAGHGS